VKISIVTPSFNSACHVRETILSVLSQQGDFSIEYLIIDNCSTDETIEIVEEFQRCLAEKGFPLGCNNIELIFISEPDNGMYDAINRGFGKASGDIHAWLNSDDIYLPGAFATITKVFSLYEDIHWVKGITSYISEDTTSIWRTGQCLMYAQSWIRKGIYGRDHYFIQQDSVFWRAHMWDRTGGIDHAFRLAGDYYLWTKFSEHSPLVSVNALVSCFRTVDGQLSQDLQAYNMEVKNFLPGDDALSSRSRLFIKHEKRLPGIIKKYIFRLLFGREIFMVVLINAKGKMKKISGEYYDVLKRILRSNT
jgi:glycosyltransferase involved in cell wall biosynthesis